MRFVRNGFIYDTAESEKVHSWTEKRWTDYGDAPMTEQEAMGTKKRKKPRQCKATATIYKSPRGVYFQVTTGKFEGSPDAYVLGHPEDEYNYIAETLTAKGVSIERLEKLGFQFEEG